MLYYQILKLDLSLLFWCCWFFFPWCLLFILGKLCGENAIVL